MGGCGRPSARRAFAIPAVTWVVGLGAWLALVGTGVVLLWNEKTTSGAAALAPERWPGDSVLIPERERATIVMLAHPHCPCTRASLGELASLMAVAGTRASAHVLFLAPEDTVEGWEQTELWRTATAIPGVAVHADRGGREAARFGAATSGQTLVYDSAGRLRFRGGITDARGHYGDSVGKGRIVALLGGSADALGVAPVFGCALDEPPAELRR